MFIKPVAGRIVIDPDTHTVLAPEGEEKPDTSFWRRRLNAGAVAQVEPPKADNQVAPPQREAADEKPTESPAQSDTAAK